MNQINRIILGTAQFGLNYGISNSSGKLDKKDVFKLFDKAFEYGVSILDTAEVYGNAHALIGEYNKRQTKFLINTKLKIVNSNIKKQIDQLLLDLNVDVINTFMFHSPSGYFDANSKIIESLNEIKNSGKINNIGISLYTNEDILRTLDESIVSIIQAPFNLLDNNFQRKSVFNNLENHHKEIHVRSIFLQGLFLKEESKIPNVLKPLLIYIQKLKDIANNEGLTIEQLALAYVVAQKKINNIIIGVDNLFQLENNIQLLEKKLSRATKKLIDEIDVNESNLLYPYNWK
jgi:aryl-alcohol dehydrogenase-like predicted oxidoreductase